MTVTAQLRSALAERYRLENELGAGGMATVYLAEDLKHRRKVAIKVLHAELSAVLGPERFLKEIETTAALQHPHILPLFDSGEAEGLLYYTMPYVRGESLRTRLDRERQLPLDEVVRLASAIAGALDYAHREGVIHRDLKPENILLADGQPLVADFGIALAVSRAGGQRVTQTGLSLGTPQYMSPEQATADRAIDGRTDLYSLGAVTYEMLTGEPPHTGSTAQAVIARVLTETPRAVRATRPSVPMQMDYAVARALEKLPADRWPTAHDFAEALAGNASAATLPAAVRADRTRSATGARVRTLLPWAAAGVFAIVAGVLFRQARSQPPARLTWFTVADVGDSSHITGAALSPDGSTLVLAAGSSDSSRLYVRRMDDPAPHPLAGGENGVDPFFSGDGQWVGFSRADGRLVRVPVGGGTPAVIAELASPAGESWSPGGVIVTGMSAYSDAFSGLWRLSGDSGAPQRLTHPGASAMHHFPVILPDGETVLFSNIERGRRRLAVGSVGSGAFTVLDAPADQPIGASDGHVLYVDDRGGIWAAPFDARRHRLSGTPVHVQELRDDVRSIWLASDGTLAYYARPAGEQPVLVDSSGHQQALPAFGDLLFSARMSPDGRRIAFVAGGSRGGVYIYDIAAQTYTRLTHGALRFVPPTWSPDGTRIAYAISDKGLWWQRADGSSPAEQLLALPAVDRVSYCSFSPDGKLLAVSVTGADSAKNDHIFVTSLAAPSTLVPFAATAANEYAPRWSLDGRWIAYVSDETGRDEVYVRAYPGGERVRISDQGGSSAAWTRDGRLLYRTGDRIVAATLVTSGGTTTVGHRAVVYAGPLAPATPYTGFDAAPDGEHLVLFAPSTAERPRVVVGVNWRQAVLEPQLK